MHRLPRAKRLPTIRAHHLLLPALLLGFVLGSLLTKLQFRQKLNKLRYHITLNRYTNPIPSEVPQNLPRITLITSAYKGYSKSRQKELSLTRIRNLHTRIHHHTVCEHAACTHSTSANVSFEHLPQDKIVTYGQLFRSANNFPGVVILANADVYFDASIHCARLLSPLYMLALSRHPSPDCIASASGHSGFEPSDMCHFYNPHTAASHDAFIFHTPVPQGVIDALEGQRINEMGAENRVLSILRLHAGVRDVVNPCERIHAFHLHCGMERAPSALGRGREGHGVREWGFVTGWMGKHERAFGEVDCLAFGGMLET